MQQLVTSILDVGTKQIGSDAPVEKASAKGSSGSSGDFNQFYQRAQEQNTKQSSKRQTHAEKGTFRDDDKPVAKREKPSGSAERDSAANPQQVENNSSEQQAKSSQSRVSGSAERTSAEQAKSSNNEDSDTLGHTDSEAGIEQNIQLFVDNFFDQLKLIEETESGAEQPFSLMQLLTQNDDLLDNIDKLAAVLSPEQLEKLQSLSEELIQLQQVVDQTVALDSGTDLDELAAAVAKVAFALSELYSMRTDSKPLDITKFTAKLKENLKTIYVEASQGTEKTEFQATAQQLSSQAMMQQLLVGTEVEADAPLMAKLLKMDPKELAASNDGKVKLDLDKLHLMDKSFDPQMVKDIDNLAVKFDGVNNAQLANQNTADEFAVTTASADKTSMLSSTRSADSLTTVKTMGTPINIHKPEGQQALSERIQVMVNGRVQSADIRLDPPELGSMQIRINMNNDQASVSIVVQSQQAKDALDQAIPKLKDLLAQQGIELGESSIQQESKQSDQTEQESESQLADNSQNLEQELAEKNVATRIVNGAIGGIDFYA